MIKGDEMNFYLDFEATRFSNRIISIGCTNERGATFKTYVKPKNGKVDNFITELTGITKEMVDNAPSADEAFNAFGKWAYENSEDTVPKYYCYGNCDEEFLDATIRTMSDFKAISFAASVKALLIDYAPIVKEYLCTELIALKKVVALIEDKDEVVQRHDALEDAEMLRTVVENLQSKCTPADASKLANMKSARKPNTNKNGVPQIFLSWDGKKKFRANTRGNQNNYQLKCWSGKDIKYFDNIETAVLWVIKYVNQSKSPKKEKDLNSVRSCIWNAINNNQKYCDLNWEVNKNNNTK